MEKIKGHILCVDDDADTREMLTALFGLEGYEVSVTGSIAKGLQLALERRFDLFLLDWTLKDGTGIELCRALRNMEPTAPILFSSGMDLTAEQLNGAMQAGAQGLVAKPIDVNNLLLKVSDLLSLSKSN